MNLSSINGVSKAFSDSDQSLDTPTYNSRKRGSKKRGIKLSPWKRFKGLGFLVGLLVLFFLINWWMLFRLNHSGFGPNISKSSKSSLVVKEDLREIMKVKRPQKTPYGRLLKLAAHALAEGQNKPEPKGLWEEPYDRASNWRPCAEERDWEPSEGNNGYIMVTANGGLNQQRVAQCLEGCEEEHFINYLKPDIRIVKELPEELQSLDLDAIDSVVTDEDIMKEAKPSFYRKNILPLLLRNKVLHFLGFGNRLAFDPIPSQLQRLRCRCNFYALQFVPKIQEAGALVLQRIRQNSSYAGPLDSYLLGPYAKKTMEGKRGHSVKIPKFLALHLRFEIDMVAHSLCEFGGGEAEWKELEIYRQIHFPALTLLKKNEKLPTPDELRSEGLCPLTPEEAVLMLAALGFNRKTHIFLAGAQIYGGPSRLATLTSLYPHLVTKEKLLSPSELEPFKNFSSQLAALDFIGCTAAEAFAMTDSGSQLSALVSGFRMYYGGGLMPTIRPNKRRLADIFLKNSTIEWKVFEQRMRKAVRQTKSVHRRPTARSIYRHPRCKECMCLSE